MAKEGFCPICNDPIDIIVRCGKFVNDKYYNEVCYTCFSCVKTCGPINNNPENDWEYYPNTDVVHIHTKKEMIRDGWVSEPDQKKVEYSLKHIKSAIKKAGKKIIQEDIKYPEEKTKKKK